jgi:hypothetical protein
MDRSERIKRCSSLLVDHVFERLAETDCGCGAWSGERYEIQIPHKAYEKIQRLVAEAIVDMYDRCQEERDEMLAMALNPQALPPPPVRPPLRVVK